MLYTHKVGGSNPSSPTMHAQRPRTIPRPFFVSCWACGYGPYALDARRTPSMYRIRSERNVRCVRIADGIWARILAYSPRWNVQCMRPCRRNRTHPHTRRGPCFPSYEQGPQTYRSLRLCNEDYSTTFLHIRQGFAPSEIANASVTTCGALRSPAPT